ncbi:MAG: TRAP transporter large permease subunit [Spirochaetota bacterium]|nr:TRAP transporter large permease subunit [Spirochaetota bacterium]
MINRIIKYWHTLENGLAIFSLFLLALIPTTEVIARKFFNTGIMSSTDYTHHLVLFIAFIGGMITSREGRHLILSLNLRIREPLQSYIRTLVAVISSMMTSAFAWSSLSFIINGFSPSMKVGFIPIQLVSTVMLVGYGMMSLRFVLALPKNSKGRFIAGTGLIFGAFLALEPIVNILHAIFGILPDFIISIQQFGQFVNAVIALPIIICLIISSIFGAPIFVVLGGTAYMLFIREILPLEIIANEAYSMLISHSIPAIPLFAVTGFILSESKAGERLLNLFRSFFSWIPGGLAIVAILVCCFFTTFTGASGVTILAMGALLSYVLAQGRYNKGFNIGLLTTSGSIGLLFPPSLPIIIYGVTAQLSIKNMFIGGIVPGITMTLSLIIFGIIYAIRNNVEREPLRIKKSLLAVKESLWEILLPIIILLSYFGGLTTLVESAAIAVIYSIIIAVFVHRDIKITDLSGIILKSVPILGGVLTILALAKGLSYYTIDAHIPMQLTNWIQDHISSKYLFLLILNIALLITGCFIDIFSAILVTVPIIIPLGNLFGINPIHLGIIFLANLELGYLTPPVGLNLFMASYRFDEPMNKIYKYVLPFFLIQLGALLLITYIPFLSTGLLELLSN